MTSGLRTCWGNPKRHRRYAQLLANAGVLPAFRTQFRVQHVVLEFQLSGLGRTILKTNTGDSLEVLSGKPITSSAEGGCPDLDPFRGSGCGAKLICNRLVRLAKTVRFLGPLIAAVHCHSPSSRTRRERSRLERASPAALQPTSPRHKRLKSSSVGSRKPAERDIPAEVRSKALRRARRESTKLSLLGGC